MSKGICHQLIDDDAARDGCVDSQQNTVNIDVQVYVPRAKTIGTSQIQGQAVDVLTKVDPG